MTCYVTCHTLFKRIFFKIALEFYYKLGCHLTLLSPQFTYSTIKGYPFLKASSIHCFAYSEAEGHQTKTCHPNLGNNQKVNLKLERINFIKHYQTEEENHNANLNSEVCRVGAHLQIYVWQGGPCVELLDTLQITIFIAYDFPVICRMARVLYS